MTKPLKFYQTLNQAPRSAKHGKHRRAGSPAHGHSFVGADFSAGGSDAVYTLVSWSSTQSVSWDPGEFTRPEPQPIPYAGVRTGELIAYRAWMVSDQYELRSLAHHFIWQPGEAVSGDISKPVPGYINALRVDPIMGGVYTHASADLTRDDVTEEWSYDYPINIERTDPDMPFGWSALGLPTTFDTFIGMALGTVKLWGEVVEHKRGYRASFAKIVSIDDACGVVDLDRLRARYTPDRVDS